MEALSGGLPVEDLAWTFVEHLLVGAELLIRDQGEVGALGEVVTDAVVLAFAGGPFPRAMGVTEEDLELEVGGEALMFGHFLALVIGEALTQNAWQGREFAFEGFAHARGVLLRKMAEEGVAGRALDQDADGGAVASADDQVAFVVAGDEPGFDFGRAFVNQHHVLELALGRGDTTAPGTAGGMVPTQAGDQFALQFPSGHNVNVAVDRLVAGMHGGQIGVVAPEAAGHFLRRPAPTQARMHFRPKRRVLLKGRKKGSGR